MNSEVILIGAPLRFYSHTDEANLFRWLKKVKSIQDIKGVGSELHLYFKSKEIPVKELRELMAIYTRYSFNFNELSVFMNESNKHWFED